MELLKSIDTNFLLTPILLVRDNQLIDANEAFLKTFHFNHVGELKGKSFTDISADFQLSGEVSFVEFKKMTDFFHDKKTLRFTWIFQKQNKEVIYSYCTLKRLENKEAILEITDVTDLQKMLIQSQEISFRFQNMFNEAPVGIILRDLQGKILHANQKMQQIIGYQEEELASVPFNLLLTDKALKIYESFKVTMDLMEKLDLHETELINQEGHVVPVSNAEMVVKDQRGVKQIWSFITDLTEIKKNAKELEVQQMKALASAKLASIGEMASGIAHEVNNPLTIISGKARLINRSLKNVPVNSQEIADHCAKIETTVHRISKIITGLKNFSRDTDNEEPKKVNLSKLIDETFGFCAERFKNHGIEVEITVPSEIFLDAREVQLSQVILNLLNNAHDAIHEENDSWIKIIAEEKNKSVFLRIIDSGKGIPIEIQEKMFQPFFTTKEVGEGTGLGLSISRGMVEKNQGLLYIDQELPNTCFVLEFPKSN